MLSTGSDLQTSWVMMNFSKTLKLFMILFCNIFIIFFSHPYNFPSTRQTACVPTGQLMNLLFYSSGYEDILTPSLLQINTSRKCRYTIVNYNIHRFSSTKWVNLPSSVKMVFKHRLRTSILVSLHSVC